MNMTEKASKVAKTSFLVASSIVFLCGCVASSHAPSGERNGSDEIAASAQTNLIERNTSRFAGERGLMKFYTADPIESDFNSCVVVVEEGQVVLEGCGAGEDFIVSNAKIDVRYNEGGAASVTDSSWGEIAPYLFIRNAN